MFEKVKSAEDAVTRIIDWEIEAGETFTDYFMHDTVDDGAWAYWLLAKGYVKHANNILMEILAGEKCIAQDILYEVYDEREGDNGYSEENIVKNIELMAEFLFADSKYLELLNKFLEKNQKEE
jgi:hypothetical protein